MSFFVGVTKKIDSKKDLGNRIYTLGSKAGSCKPGFIIAGSSWMPHFADIF